MIKMGRDIKAMVEIKNQKGNWINGGDPEVEYSKEMLSFLGIEWDEDTTEICSWPRSHTVRPYRDAGEYSGICAEFECWRDQLAGYDYSWFTLFEFVNYLKEYGNKLNNDFANELGGLANRMDSLGYDHSEIRIVFFFT